MSEVLVERLSGADAGIVRVGLNRPEAKNALGRSLMQAFRETLAGLRFDPSVRVVVLHSTVPGVFCAGADLKERASMTPPEVSAFVHGLRSAFSEVEDLPMPVVAVIEGAAFGGGLELALAADVRIAGEAARMGLVETGLAIIPGAGGTQRLPRLIGKARAKELIFTARKLDAPAALALGIVEYVTPAGQGMEKAMDLAREILPNGPIAVRMAKQAVNRGIEVDRDSGMAIEQACYAQVVPTQDRLEGLAAFKEKRTPIYRGE